MPASAIPQVIDALVSTAREAMPKVNVYDGLPVTDEPGDWLMIGVEDPDIEGAANSADADQSWAAVGTGSPTDEEGDVVCCALSWTGDGGEAGAKQARDDLEQIMAGLATAIATSPGHTLGVPCLLWLRFGSSLQFSQAQGEYGASASYIFRIHFRARF